MIKKNIVNLSHFIDNNTEHLPESFLCIGPGPGATFLHGAAKRNLASLRTAGKKAEMFGLSVAVSFGVEVNEP